MSKPSARAILPVEPKEVIWNPSAERLRELTEAMPNTRVTRYHNTNTQTRVDARSKLSTYVVSDAPERHDSQTITRAEYERVARLQNDYVRSREMIVVDGFITRVFNSDYFGESKKGGLRMWNQIVYDRGGLALHAGCKVIPVAAGTRVGLIIGLSGTGKTTTTFTKQNNSQPVQDDFCALMPGGKVYATENGCFAKTFGLNPNDEPTIYYACASPHAYLENVSQAA